jgi:hypothetical protein
MSGSNRSVYTSMKIETDLGSVLDGEKFWLGGTRYEVVENRYTRYVLCKELNRAGTLNLDQETVVEIDREE